LDFGKKKGTGGVPHKKRQRSEKTAEVTKNPEDTSK